MEAAATSGDLRCELKQQALAGISRVAQVVDLEVLEVGALVGELLQRPLLQAVLVEEVDDGELLQALLLVDCTPKHVEERVDHVGRGAHEVLEFHFGGPLMVSGEFIPARDVVLFPHAPAFVHLDTVENDGAILDVHGLRAVGVGLEGEGQERLVLDVEEELVPLHNVVQRDLPAKRIVIQFEREHILVAQFTMKFKQNVRSQKRHLQCRSRKNYRQEEEK